MIKKEAKKEVASCETCSCGSCCGGNCLGTILAALWFIAAIVACFYACKASNVAQKVYDVNVLSAGGEANFERMNKVYQSDAYVEYATQNAEQAEAYFGLNEVSDEDTIDTDDTINSDDTDSTNSNESIYNFSMIAWWDEIKTVVEDMLASSPVRGDANARFTIVEYTELLCPYCQRHSQAWTINSTIEEFPGEINSISKSFIIHGEEALGLSAAMECISELNPDAYHQVFEKAFEAYPVDMSNLINIATELGTDASALQACVDEWRYVQAVNDGMNQWAQLFGVNGTPGNVIIDRETGNYIVVSGAYPLDAFVEAVNDLKNA